MHCSYAFLKGIAVSRTAPVHLSDQAGTVYHEIERSFFSMKGGYLKKRI